MKNGCEPFEQLDADRGRMHVAQPVEEPLGLFGNGCGYARVGMSGIRDTERRRAIDVRVAVDIGDVRAPCGFPKDREVFGEVGDVARLARLQARSEPRAFRARNLHVSFPIQRTNSAMRGLPPWKTPRGGACSSPNRAMRAAPTRVASSSKSSRGDVTAKASSETA